MTPCPPIIDQTALYLSQGIHFFVQLHLDGAGVKECDHWHDDAGKLRRTEYPD